MISLAIEIISIDLMIFVIFKTVLYLLAGKWSKYKILKLLTVMLLQATAETGKNVLSQSGQTEKLILLPHVCVNKSTCR